MDTTTNMVPEGESKIERTVCECGNAFRGIYCLECGRPAPDGVVTIFDIPVVNFPRFEMSFNKLAKKAKRLGAESIGFEVLRTYARVQKYADRDGVERKRKTVFNEVRVWGPRPKLNGWALVGRLDFAAVPGATLRMMVPGETCPVQFTEVEPGRCDHCGTRRRRNDSFIVRHDDGREQCVGRQCLADFLGHVSPAHVASMCTTLSEICAMGQESERDGWGGGGEDYFDVAEVLATTIYSIRERGWKSSKEENSTRSDVMRLLTPTYGGGYSVEEVERARKAELAKITERDVERADEVIAWVLEQDTTKSDYLHNLKAICSAAVSYKTAGIACSAVIAYDRAMGREAERKAKPVSGHVGKVGDRIELDLTVAFTRYIEGNYGTTTVVKFTDDAGNVFTWFASGGKDIERGQRYAVRGTVKKHDQFNGERQTVLTRCKLEAAA